MSTAAILAPVFAQVALTFVLAFAMGVARRRALRDGLLDRRAYETTRRGWPARAQQIGDSYHNQFELPVLFYAVMALALITHQADFGFVALAWLFVICRVVQAGVHVTANVIIYRFAAFAGSVAALCVMWAVLAAHICLA